MSQVTGNSTRKVSGARLLWSRIRSRRIPSFVQRSLPILSGALVWPLSIPPSLPKLLLSTLLCLLGIGVSPPDLISPHRTRNSLTPWVFFKLAKFIYAQIGIGANRSFIGPPDSAYILDTAGRSGLKPRRSFRVREEALNLVRIHRTP
jgi:hypothetical protein